MARSEGAARPELSDLVVDFDPRSLERRNIALIRSHLELQRLHEEFRVAALLRDLVAPLVPLVRRCTGRRPVRVVDLGCGLGYIVRWLAAHGGLGADVELIGADCNRTLVSAARTLAADEGLPCRFAAGNAFALKEPADVIVSTGVLHHFRGDALTAVFAEHERSAAMAPTVGDRRRPDPRRYRLAGLACVGGGRSGGGFDAGPGGSARVALRPAVAAPGLRRAQPSIRSAAQRACRAAAASPSSSDDAAAPS